MYCALSLIYVYYRVVLEHLVQRERLVLMELTELMVTQDHQEELDHLDLL